MKKRIMLFIFGLCIAGILQAQEPKQIPGQYIVVLKESSAKPVIKQQKKNNNREEKAKGNNEARQKGLAKAKEVRGNKGVNESSVIAEYADVLVGFTAKLSDKQKSDLQNDPDVEGVYPDYVVQLGPTEPEPNPKDVTFSNQTPIDFNYGQTNNAKGPSLQDNTYLPAPIITAADYIGCFVTRAGGWVDGSAKGTWIWILDTGINLAHPDLNVQTNATFARSFIAGESIEDGNGHGTHCSGIAAGKANGFGIVGVSAGAKVVPVKVLSNAGSGAWSGILGGLNHVAMYDIPGDVVNMSLGGYGYSNCEAANPSLTAAVRNLGYAGTYVCIAAGNNGNCTGGPITLPGCINGPNVFTVGALNCDLTKASYSNGGTNVDFVQIGTSVYSTYRYGAYATLSGTSMATPVVAGIIHARGGAPANGGNIPFCGTTKPLARR